MRAFVHAQYLAERWLFLNETPAMSRNLYLALSMTAFNDADLNAVSVSAVTTFTGHEYNGASYARQAVGSITITKDGTFHTWNLKDSTVDFGRLGAGSASAKWALLYMGATNSSSGDGVSIPIAVYDNAPTFPFTGNGTRKLRLRAESRGFLYGPNCTPTSNIALTVGDSLYLYRRAI